MLTNLSHLLAVEGARSASLKEPRSIPRRPTVSRIPVDIEEDELDKHSLVQQKGDAVSNKGNIADL